MTAKRTITVTLQYEIDLDASDYTEAIDPDAETADRDPWLGQLISEYHKGEHRDTMRLMRFDVEGDDEQEIDGYLVERRAD